MMTLDTVVEKLVLPFSQITCQVSLRAEVLYQELMATVAFPICGAGEGHGWRPFFWGRSSFSCSMGRTVVLGSSQR